MSTETPTEQLRAQVKHQVACPVCGRGMGLRKAAEQSGVGASVLSRFLAGRAISSDTFDALAIWVKTAGPD